MAVNTTISKYDVKYLELLLNEIVDFRKNEQFIDVTLICGNLRYAAHKIILSAASAYFRAMFGGNFPESIQSEVKLHELNANCLQHVLDFIYSSKIQLDMNNVQAILEIAAFLQIDRLVEVCVTYMLTAINANNCLDFKYFAEKQNNLQLLQGVQDFICSNFQEVVQSEEFVHLSYSQILSILNRDQLYMYSDDIVMKGLVQWAEHEPDKRMPILGSLLRHIHPSCINAQLATSLLETHKQADAGEIANWLHEVANSEHNMEWCVFVLDKMGRQASMMRYDINFEQTVHLKALPNPAFALSFVNHKNILYVQGGSIGRSKSDSFYYNIYLDQWNKLCSLLIPRSHHRSLIWDDYLYALGGNNVQGTTCSMECLNLNKNRAIMRECMKSPRASMGAVTYMNALHVMGGETERRSLYSMELYDPREGQWHDLPAMHNVNSYCSSAVIDNNIYCCEGLGSCMERYDCRAQRWVTIDFWEEREFYEIFAVDNKLYSIYGEGIARYDVENVQWINVHTFPEQREWDTVLGMKMLNYTF